MNNLCRGPPGDTTYQISKVNYNYNPFSDMPILGSYNSAANKNMMSKIWTNWVHISE